MQKKSPPQNLKDFEQANLVGDNNEYRKIRTRQPKIISDRFKTNEKNKS
jgi:hypothetical protein